MSPLFIGNSFFIGYNFLEEFSPLWMEGVKEFEP
jgi:hypothetical protein